MQNDFKSDFTNLKVVRFLGAGHYSHEVRTKTVLESIIESAKALKSQGTPITQQSVVIHSKCSLSAVKRVWKILATQFNLYAYSNT